MTAVARNYPGYFLALNPDLLQNNISQARQRIANLIGIDLLTELEKCHAIVLHASPEHLPEMFARKARQEAMASCAYIDLKDNHIHVDSSQYRRYGFAAEVAAITAFGLLGGVLGKCRPARMLARLAPVVQCWYNQAQTGAPSADKRQAALLSPTDHAFVAEAIIRCHFLQFASGESLALVTSITAGLFLRETSLEEDLLAETRTLLARKVKDLSKIRLKHVLALAMMSLEELPALFHRYKLGMTVRVATDSKLTISRIDLSNPAFFFSQSTIEKLDSENRFQYRANMRLLAPGADYAQSWTDMTEPLVQAEELSRFAPLSDPSIRPLWTLYPVFYGPNVIKPAAARMSIVRTGCADLASHEYSSASTLPHFVSPDAQHLIKISHVEISNRLDWALLWVYNDNGLYGGMFPALCPSWSLQAPKIDLRKQYAASVALFTTRVTRSTERSRFGLRFERSSSVRAKLPSVTATVFYQSAKPCGSVAGTKFVQVTGNTQSDGQGHEIIAVVSLDMLKPLGPITRADGIVLKGYMLATDLEVHDPILLPDNVVSAVNNLPSGRPAIARRLSRILYTADLPVHLIGNVASRLMELMRTRTPMGRRLQKFYVDVASMCGNVSGLMVKAADYIDKERTSGVTTPEPLALLIAAAMRGSKEALTALIVPSPISERLPDDVVDALIAWAGLEQDSGSAQHVLARLLLNDRTPEQLDLRERALYLNLLQHSVVANGFMAGAFNLAHCWAAGFGTEPDLETARWVLQTAAQNGYLHAQYWLAGFGHLGANFFTADEETLKAAFEPNLKNGAPASLIVYGLYALFGCHDRDHELVAYAIFDWVDKTIRNHEARQIKELIRKNMSSALRERIDGFDVWRHLGISAPPSSIDLVDTMGDLDGPIIMHPPFMEELDPDLDYTNPKPSSRLMGQVSFFSENSEPVLLGYAARHEVEHDPSLRVSAFGHSGGPAQGDQLVIVSISAPETKSWDVNTLYPVFEKGTRTTFVLQGGACTQNHACAVLTVSPSNDRQESSTLAVFDPLWPLMSRKYRTGDRYCGILYGLADKVSLNAFGLKDLPEHIQHAVMEKTSNVRQRRFVSLSCVNAANAFYRVNSGVQHVEPNCCMIGGISFARVDVDNIIVTDEQDAETFPIYVAQRKLDALGTVKPGDRFEAYIELHAYMLDDALHQNITLQ